MKTKLSLLLLLALVLVSYGQQDSQYSQYMYNTIAVNPAYAGSRESMSIFVLHRTQWTGFDGAPVTNVASISAPINESKVGIGVSFVNDRIGPSEESTISADFSYTIPISYSYKLAFGLKATANLLNIDFTKLNIRDLNDYQFDSNIDNKFSPNVGVGLYLYSDTSYLGLSAPNLLQTKYFDRSAGTTNSSHVAIERVHFYLIGGHVIDMNYRVKFKPTIQASLVQGAPLQVNLSANFVMNDKFVAGLSYRLSAAVSAMVGFQTSRSWFFGYSYDLETTRLSNYNSGSHEIFMRFEVFNRFNQMSSPRFF
ncbi:PorP/SprF family type IX secretion system membrane protein [Flavobacterium sandaracinum]|uniref:Type IX secretion system membrane protein PorP/SprF n=1 Tax=Flavobacterium sandaracinum TaxID=2541733 RepID=A0A4V2Z1H7_9FLAO|nr:type IX secretion system membrane protein PorP/SprF [Flavobacterium sandaracinum]TDE05138.1 type IX secretion system membrane protein PorP/SprF [Flavobacterium sandaracinum]